MPELRYYQEEAVDAMLRAPEHNVGCIVMPCGTGKTAVVTNYIDRTRTKLTIIVFPRLALIDQYLRGYILEDVRYIVVGTLGYSAVNDGEEILDAIDNNDCVVILTTYISIIPLSRLLEPQWLLEERERGEAPANREEIAEAIDGVRERLARGAPAQEELDEALGDLAELQVALQGENRREPPRIDCVIYDESHHTNTDKQELAERFLSPVRTFYFTATPVDNHRNVIYRYTYHQALQDGYSRPFVISVYATAQPKTPKTVYEMLGYFAKKHNLSNTIVFHRYANVPGGDTGTSVDDYVRYAGFVGDGAGEGAVWDIDGEPLAEGERGAAEDLEEYLPEGTEIVCIKGSTPIPQRVQILERAKDEGNYMVIHTCKTMSEGVDTQKIVSICPLDEMNDEVATTQAIGRIMRKDFDNPDAPSYLLVPFFGMEGRGGVRTRDSIQGFADTSLKKRNRNRRKQAVADAEPEPEDWGVPRYVPLKNETFEINLNKLESNSQIKTISGILSFFAKDRPQEEVLPGENPQEGPFQEGFLKIDELHKQVSAFEIEAYHAEHGDVAVVDPELQAHARARGAAREVPKILYYGHNDPLGKRNPKSAMIALAKKFVTVFEQDHVKRKRTGDPDIYAFADFIADVVENDDQRYQRYIEIEDLFDEALGEAWEYGVYWKPHKVDERIVDIITHHRFGFPIIFPDKFNNHWERVYDASMDDKDFVNAWRDRKR